MYLTTPNKIEKLEENEVFVFGSNLNGNHLGGAALFAKDNFGAEEGVGEGLTSDCYAFPTLDKKMQKVTIKALEKSRDRLYKVARENPDKQFLVTKVGMGIASFSEEEIKPIFNTPDKPSNIILPVGWTRITGYKAFKEGLVCRGMQYELGKDFTFDGDIKLCESGFHFCLSIGNVYNYYSYGDIIAEVEAFGDVIVEGDKCVTNGLRLIRILNAETEARANSGNENSGYRNSGDRNSGDRNSGDGNSGDGNSGDGNSGNFNDDTPRTIRCFGKEIDRKVWKDAYKPSWIYFDLTTWIDFSDMTDEEKEKYPSAKITGGYLKTLEYKEAWKLSYEKASKEEQEKIKELPGFDSKIFENITGIKIN